MSAHPSDHRVSQWALDELDERQHAEFEAHLLVCAPCRARAERERRLDALVVESAFVLAPGETERVMSRFWTTLDSGRGGSSGASDAGPASEEAPGSAPRARPALRVLPWLGAAAAALLAAWWFASGDVPPSEVPDARLVLDEPAQVPPAGTSPSVAPAVPEDDGAGGPPVTADEEAFDAARLATARARVAVVVGEADEHFPFADEAFVATCDELLLPLRREGWPVGTLVRGLALGDDDLVAAAALRLALLDPSSRRVAATALERPERAAATLALLRERNLDVEGSPATLAALEQLVLDGAPGLRADALAVLAAQSGPRSARSLERLVEATARTLPRGRRRAEALEEHFALLAGAPARFAIPAALALLGDDADVTERARGLLLARCVDERAAMVEALRAALAGPRAAEGVVALLTEAGLDELVPDLLRRLERRDGASDAATLGALVTLGGARAAAGLFLLWREAAERGARATFGDALLALATSDAAALRELGAGAEDGELDDLVAFAARLPDGLATTPLWAALVARPVGQRPGRPETLLAALARLGDADDGRALLAWLAARPPDGALAPLAWAAAGSLAPRDAERAFAASGRDPRPLREAARLAQARFRLDELPSRSQLADLRRALDVPRGPPR